MSEPIDDGMGPEVEYPVKARPLAVGDLVQDTLMIEAALDFAPRIVTQLNDDGTAIVRDLWPDGPRWSLHHLGNRYVSPQSQLFRIGVADWWLDTLPRSGRLPFKVGDRVVKNPARWWSSEFDEWGSGLGVGVVVEALATRLVDVRWPAGLSFHGISELLPAPDEDGGIVEGMRELREASGGEWDTIDPDEYLKDDDR